MFFINSVNTNCDADVVILRDCQPVLISLTDIEVRNRKIIADLVAEKTTRLGHYDDSSSVREFRTWGLKFFFRSTSLGAKTHSIIKSDLSHKCAIEWGTRDIKETIAETLQYKFSIPITSDIVSKVMEYEKGRRDDLKSLHPLKVYSCNPDFQPTGYYINSDLFKVHLSLIKVDIPDSDFNWDEIVTTEDYLFRFIEPIREKLQSSIKIMLDPNKLSPGFSELGIPLYPGQVPIVQAGLEVLEREKFVYLAVEQGSGKAQKLTDKLLTPLGWVDMGSAYVGMPIIGSDGKTYSVTGVFPQGEKEAFEVFFQDDTSVVCCKEHLWATKTQHERNKDRDWTIRSLESMVDIGIRKTAGNWQKSRGYRGSRNFSIPLVAPVAFPERQLPIHPYLLGALLGDGSMRKGTISLSVPDSKFEVEQEVQGCLPKGIKVRKDYSTPCPRLVFLIADNGPKNYLNKTIKDLGLRVNGGEKFIPDVYKYASVEQRMELLRGLMDTDGSCCKNRTSFHSMCRQLSNDVAAIVRSLGGEAKVRVFDRTKSGKGIEFDVNVKMNVCPFTVTYKAKQWKIGAKGHQPAKMVDRVESVGKMSMQCISVDAPDNMYVTNDYIVTHNTVMASAINGMHFKGNYRSLVVAPTSTLTHWKKEILQMWPDAEVVIIRKTSEFIEYFNTSLKDKPTYFLVGKETFKLDSAKKPAVNFAVREVTFEQRDDYTVYTRTSRIEVAVCPCCGEAIRNVNRRDLTFLDSTNFSKPNKSNYKCSECGEVLWQSCYDKTKKSSLIRYIRTKNIMFDSLILDEIHQSNNSGSLIGSSVRNLIKYGKKSILLSGTTNNGYASSMHNLLMGLKSGMLQDDDCLDEGEFVKKYGTLVSVQAADEKHKRHGKTSKESDFRQAEGINPVLFTKYLARNYIFAELRDIRTDLPEIEENYVEIEAPAKLLSEQNNLISQFQGYNRFIWKMYENTIVRHYVNNPTGWVAIPVGDNVVYPNNLSLELPKEQELLKIVQNEVAEGRKVCIYTDFTGEDTCKYVTGLNPAKRIKSVLESNGIKVYWLKQSIKAFDRKDHIDSITDDYDVIISNPVLVQVGVNLQAFPTYINYIPSYMVNTVDQSNRRGYRINSVLTNRVFHLYYKNTCEHDIIKRYQLKKAESKAIESNFNFEIQSTVNRTASGLSKRLHDAMSI